MPKRKTYVSNLLGYDKTSRVETPLYDTPKEYYMTVAPANGSTEIEVYGERVFKMYKCMIDTHLAKGIKESDLVYLDTLPIDETVIGEKADYKVTSVRVQNVKTVIYIEKRI